METNIVIDPEFKALIPPLSGEEREGLEQDLLRDGCRDPLVVWRQESGDLVLLDGHNRYEICQRRNLSYKMVVLDLPSREHAKRWLLENQLNRRNLSQTQRGVLAAQIANLPAHRPAGESAQLCALSQSQAAEHQSVSRRTTQHAKRVLDHGSPKLREALKRDIIPASLASVITKLAPEEQDRIAEECIERGAAQPARVAAAKVKRRAKRRKKVAADTPADDGPRFAVVLAEPWGREPGAVSVDGEPGHQHPVVPLDTMKALGRQLVKHLQPDAVLFLRAPAPLIARALKLVEAFGFEFVAHLVCMKPGVGSDDYVMYDHELLLIGARGDELLLPNPADRPSSVMNAKVYEIIQKMYPDLPKLALFARIERPGWISWDNGAPKTISPRDEVDLD